MRESQKGPAKRVHSFVGALAATYSVAACGDCCYVHLRYLMYAAWMTMTIACDWRSLMNAAERAPQPTDWRIVWLKRQVDVRDGWGAFSGALTLLTVVVGVDYGRTAVEKFWL
jgi:hypothetical protein